ncbi:hypothetical protein GCM10022252_24070 [Streptosporangium oxazolinicum]|uniref:Uncharacterized protein n=1 Tax=Streptosporangium oxazolinicum TaxID=909287 RepID=A0ABP8AR71_9ACTN
MRLAIRIGVATSLMAAPSAPVAPAEPVASVAPPPPAPAATARAKATPAPKARAKATPAAKARPKAVPATTPAAKAIPVPTASVKAAPAPVATANAKVTPSPAPLAVATPTPTSLASPNANASPSASATATVSASASATSTVTSKTKTNHSVSVPPMGGRNTIPPWLKKVPSLRIRPLWPRQASHVRIFAHCPPKSNHALIGSTAFNLKGSRRIYREVGLGLSDRGLGHRAASISYYALPGFHEACLTCVKVTMNKETRIRRIRVLGRDSTPLYVRRFSIWQFFD